MFKETLCFPKQHLSGHCCLPMGQPGPGFSCSDSPASPWIPLVIPQCFRNCIFDQHALWDMLASLDSHFIFQFCIFQIESTRPPFNPSLCPREPSVCKLCSPTHQRWLLVGNPWKTKFILGNSLSAKNVTIDFYSVWNSSNHL